MGNRPNASASSRGVAIRGTAHYWWTGFNATLISYRGNSAFCAANTRRRGTFILANRKWFYAARIFDIFSAFRHNGHNRCACDACNAGRCGWLNNNGSARGTGHF